MRSCFKKASDGMEAIEGTIVLTGMILMLVFFISYGFFVYQQAMVVTVANDTATRTAQSYAYPTTDPIMGYVSRAMRIALDPYRYRNGEAYLKMQNAEKAENYAHWYLNRCSLAFEQGEPEIEVRVKEDGLAQRHIEVEITAEYEIPMGAMLKIIGQESRVTYHAVGYAPIIDLSDYIYTTITVKSLTSETFGSKILGAVNSVASLIQNIRNAIAK